METINNFILDNCRMTLLSREEAIRIINRHRSIFRKQEYRFNYSKSDWSTCNCEVTDFAIFTGSQIYKKKLNIDGEFRDVKTFSWYTRSVNEEYGIYTFDSLNIRSCDRDCAIRPLLLFDDIEIKQNDFKIRKNRLYKCTYGEYPQEVVDNETKQLLETELKNGNLKKTGKVYTCDKSEEINESFLPIEYEEYWYKNNKYVKALATGDRHAKELSNGDSVYKGHNEWFKVSPIEWYYLPYLNAFLSVKGIVAGVRFCNIHEYSGDFESTEMYKFLNNYLIKDIEPSVIHKTISEEVNEILEEIKKYQRYYSGNIDVEERISKIIKQYNEDIKNESQNNELLVVECKNESYLSRKLIVELNDILSEIKIYVSKYKDCYDMIDILKECQKESIDVNKHKLCENINLIKTTIFDYLSEGKEKEKLKNDLNNLLDKNIKRIELYINNSKNDPNLMKITLSDLEIEVRTDLNPFLNELSIAVNNQDVLSEIISKTISMIKNTYVENKSNRIASLFNFLKTTETRIMEKGNKDEIDESKKIMKKVENIKLTDDIKPIIKEYVSINVELYKLLLNIEDRINKQDRTNGFIVKTDVDNFFNQDKVKSL
jgi:hypothetical protein